jgi:hypothetical protein
MCFLADLLFLLANFQKKLQRDSLTIVDIKPELEVFTQKLNLLTGAPLIGGWEETFQQSVVNDNGVVTLYGHQLWSKTRRTSEANRYVTDRRDVNAIRNDTIQALTNFMSTRLHLGSEDLRHSITRFRLGYSS